MDGVPVIDLPGALRYRSGDGIAGHHDEVVRLDSEGSPSFVAVNRIPDEDLREVSHLCVHEILVHVP